MRYYIATALERAEDHRALSRALNARGWTCNYDWTAHGSVQRQGANRMAEVAEAEMRGVIGADVVIVLLPAGRGRHCELGAALAAGVPGVVVGDAEMVMTGVSLAIAGGGAAQAAPVAACGAS